MPGKLSLLVLAAILLAIPPDAAGSSPVKPPPLLGKQSPDFAMLDLRGRYYDLRRAEADVVVLFFTANGCPVARKSIPKLRDLQAQYAAKGVRIWLVNSNSGDDRGSIRKEAEEFRVGSIPVLIDEGQGVAALYGVNRTATAIAIETKSFTVFYQGALDDQFVEGGQKPSASEEYLRNALDQHLAGAAISVDRSVARGCLISFGKSLPISYSEHVAPILQDKCFGCHSTGNIGPIKFSSHSRVEGVADMIQEVILARRMPPWQADPHYGRFANDFSLTPEERRVLLRWVEQGAPRGEGEDPLLSAVPPSSEWSLGQPDAMVSLPEAQKIPATGVLDYRRIRVRAPFDQDVWVKGVVAKPGNTRVVHHIIVRVREPGQRGDNPDDAFLTAWAPGSPEVFFPEGAGKFIRKGSILDFEMHYTTSGREEEDQSTLGIYLHAEKPVLHVKTHAAFNMNFEIPPGAASAPTTATYVFQQDSLLFDLSPHMHLRGSWFKFEALYPDGKREVLLNVPRYDFNWQHSYRLKEPKRMPKGTWILCTGGFDNSERNPNNPNPKIPVHWGDQSFDEMFIGFMDIAEAPAENHVSAR